MSTIKFFRHTTRLSRYYIPTEFVVLAVVEFLALIFSLYLALEIRFWGSDWQSDFGYFMPKALVYAVVLQLSLVAFGVYQRQTGRFINMLVLRIASGLLLGLIPLGVGFYIVPTFFLGRGVLLIAVVISFVLISIIRLFFRKVIKESNVWTRVLVLGSGERAGYIRKATNTGELRGLNIVAYVAMPGDEESSYDDTVTLDGSLIDYVENQDIDEIVIAVDDRRRSGFPTRDLIDCKMSGVNILDLVTFFERRAGKIRLDMLNPSWLYLSEGFHLGSFRRIGKRVLDVCIVLVLIPIALPLAVLVSLAIFIESGFKGSVLYSQTRVKQYGVPFKIYKFRSMVINAEKNGVAQWASKNDSRITRVGRVIRKGRLDELPQLYNVLIGDMSFVGPRPERPEFVEKLAKAIPYYDERHRVKPGLTGWAQVCYSYGDTVADSIEKLQYDLYYVKNYSVLLDILILLQTAEVVMLGKGAQ
ncbi:MAG TPA: TIGR03013 family PEP-CTERM/XrtA system glycosyltransferase [Gammaproteobacteria bacterium]|nr:TIGR03013 family PEP-CTERM/XrtA system glycosyltransferase [Gammaproteobacteria bacterium]